MLPASAGVTGLLINSWSSDRLDERKWHMVVPALCSRCVRTNQFGRSNWCILRPFHRGIPERHYAFYSSQSDFRRLQHVYVCAHFFPIFRPLPRCAMQELKPKRAKSQ